MSAKHLAQYGAPTLAVFLIWIAVAGYPSMRALGAAEERQEVANVERSALLLAFEDIRALPDREEQTLQQIDDLGLLIPDGLDVGALIQSIDQAGTMNGVAVEKFSPSQIDDSSTLLASRVLPAGISSVTFGLTAQGQYESMIGFLESLEQLDRLILLDSIDIHTDAESSLVLTTEIVLRVFTSAAITQSSSAEGLSDDALAFDDGRDPTADTVDVPVLPPGLSEAEILEFLASVEGGE